MQEKNIEKIFSEKVIEINRVSRTVKGGKRIRFRALVIVGDKNGRVGLGIEKANDVSQAIKKAVTYAKKHLSFVIINERGSIKRDVTTEHGAAKVILRSAPEGTSIIAGGVVRAVAELAGFKNLVAKSIGSSNKINVALATMKGLGKASQNV